MTKFVTRCGDAAWMQIDRLVPNCPPSPAHSIFFFLLRFLFFLPARLVLTQKAITFSGSKRCVRSTNSVQLRRVVSWRMTSQVKLGCNSTILQKGGERGRRREGDMKFLIQIAHTSCHATRQHRSFVTWEIEARGSRLL